MVVIAAKTKQQFIREPPNLYFVVCQTLKLFFHSRKIHVGEKSGKVEIGTKITNNGNNITARRITTLKGKKSGNVFEDEKGRKGSKKKKFYSVFHSLSTVPGVSFSILFSDKAAA